MGSFGGHVLPGSFFIVFGVWWTLKMYYRKYKSAANHEQWKSSASFRFLFLCERVRHWPIEGVLKIFLVTVAGIIEIVTGFDGHGRFSNIGNGQHATMFLFFGINGLIDILLHFRVAIPQGMDYASMSLALIIEYILFKFHLHDRPNVDVLLHTLLLYVILATAVVVLVEMRYRQNFLLALMRPYLVTLQGTWFFQVAFILYNPITGSKPWDLDNHRNMTIVTMYFAWHMAVILVYTLCIGGLVRCFMSRRYGPTDDQLADATPFVAKGSGYTELSVLDETDSEVEFDKSAVRNGNRLTESSLNN